jgi:hypothetical protein
MCVFPGGGGGTGTVNRPRSSFSIGKNNNKKVRNSVNLISDLCFKKLQTKFIL